jgi:GH24 family phage-related lysozyme (muramidase)
MTPNQRIRKLETALRPFAEEAATWADSVSNSYRPGMTEPRQQQTFAKACFNLGHLRRAAKLLGMSQAK